MAYDQNLATRIRKHLKGQKRLEEKEMMGGLTFMVNGHMAVGIVKDELMVRVGSEQHDKAVKRPGARIMDFTKKPMKGFIFVNADGFTNDNDLKEWIALALNFNRTLKPG